MIFESSPHAVGPVETLKKLEVILQDEQETINAAIYIREMFNDPLNLSHEEVLARHKRRLELMIS